jgi:hypothetical protein
MGGFVMGLILSIVAALAGSTAGSAVRAGMGLAERQLESGEGEAGPLVISGSLVAGVAGGVLVDALGGKAATAFWLGAVLGAAGAERLDWWVFRRFGIDPEKLVARARDAAERRTQSARGKAKPA